MLHILGRDAVNNTFTFLNQHDDSSARYYRLVKNYFTLRRFPWMWSGVNELIIRRTSDQVEYTITFESTDHLNDSRRNTVLANAFSSVPEFVSAGFTAPDLEGTFVFSVDFDILWSQSSCAPVFLKTVDEIAVTTSTWDNHNLLFPHVLGVVIDDVRGSCVATDQIGVPPTMFIATIEQMEQPRIILRTGQSMTLHIYKPGISVEIPLNEILEFELLFALQ